MRVRDGRKGVGGTRACDRRRVGRCVSSEDVVFVAEVRREIVS